MVTDTTFENTLNVFIEGLENYDENGFRRQDNPNSWSLAQLYAHIIIDTNWYFDQLESCFGNVLNLDKSMEDKAKKMLLQNSFPDIKIKGNSYIPVNDSIFINATKKDLILLLERSRVLWKRINNENISGKAEHPGFSYLSPMEWYQFAEMHIRHHIQQKKEIENKIKSS
ncbi:DinB superfamily protein [Chryseobacterium oranimense]|uniref:DinB superfamily protein n=1 Tax=Chryseobacterium oranimense TaxID=421058 RepID=A0A1M5TR00_9FLAO|nr:DinB family protein [Chryseobacterium oranimense]SHH53026.1 DinB superfamily protein [Chryseobacterium oranimense]